MEFLKLSDKQNILNLLAKVLIVLFSILAISLAVGIFNQIKGSKYIGQDAVIRNTVSVTGTGEVYVKPDLALVNFSVVTEKKTVSAAMSENNDKMKQVLEALKGSGIEEKDLKTINFSIYPRYEYTDKDETQEGQRVLVGYEITQTVQAKIRDLAQTGQIIEQATTAGANQVGELVFTIDQREEFEKQAREEAIKEARERADEIADQLGVDLSRIISFSENSFGYFDGKGGFGVGGGGLESAATPQIAIGESKVEVSVYITYEIN